MAARARNAVTASKLCVLWLILYGVGFGRAWADPAPFDLVGPKLDIRVTRAGAVLPITETPNLSSGDQLWIRADLPAAQSVHYLLVAAFLRGATNPPPKNWFYQSQTWSAKDRDGLRITVPQGAQQILAFLAPRTGGDFKALVNAVRGRPGAFVRASQDLNQASLDRARLDRFLAAVRRINQADPGELKTASPLLARSLAIKLNADCLQKSPELQASCLMQRRNSVVLNDGDSATMVGSLTSGDSANLIQALSGTPQAGSGYFSGYVGAVMDIARLLDSLHTAHYQYIPALTIAESDELSLALNAAPSFQNPMSVLVAALPAVEPSTAPALRPVDPNAIYCAEQPDLVVPVEGAPLAFSTDYAHDMTLRFKGKNGEIVDAPVKADPAKGGFVADTAAVDAATVADEPEGFLHGYWGFTPFDGPRVHLENASSGQWTLAAEDRQALVVGRNDAIRLRSPDAACVASISMLRTPGAVEKLAWKLTRPDEVSITAPLKDAQPGPATLLIRRYGAADADIVPVRTFAQAGHLDTFSFHAGDRFGVLKGARLDEVAELTFKGVAFQAADFTTTKGEDQLSLVTSDVEDAGKLKAGEAATAKVALKDGRTVNLKVSVEPSRPRVVLIRQSVQPSPSRAASKMIELSNADEIPQGAILTFSIRALAPTRFLGREQVEVATNDGAFSTSLSVADGLVLEDSAVALATLDTARALGPSAYGPLRFRVIADGVAGDWQPLATLVRLPVIADLQCPSAPDDPCELSGADLFLIRALANNQGFDHAVSVPEGFTDHAIDVPRPMAGRLYIKLHDDPSVVHPLDFPTEQQPSRSNDFAATSTARAPIAANGEKPSDLSPARSGLQGRAVDRPPAQPALGAAPPRLAPITSVSSETSQPVQVVSP